MKAIPLDEIVKIIEGTVISGKGNPLINNIENDRLKIKSGKSTLFFHFSSKRGLHPLRQKNVVIVTDNPGTAKNGNIVIKVDNVREAYWSLMSHYRSLFHIPVVGITGTSGKTTTKEMITQVLTLDGLNVQSTYRSFNLGRMHLLKFLEMDDQTDAAVIEMGLLKPGDVSLACKYFQPTIRIILNIDVYHLQGCKTMENYIKAKAEIMDGMKTEDLLIINADDHNIKKIDLSHVAQKLTFGINEPADYMAKEMEQTDKGIRFKLIYKNKEYPAVIPGYGKHNIYNALASIAAIHHIGLDIEEVIDKLPSFQHLESHLQQLPGIKGCLIIDDSWNNTPLAMEGALNVLKDTAKGKKIAALGSFPQIGKNQEAKEQYRYMASKVMEAKADKLIILDEKAKEIAVNARKMGMKPNDIHYCFTENAVYKTLKPIVDANTVVLFKFSKILRKSLFKLIKTKIIK